jgi:hypothetical protein
MPRARDLLSRFSKGSVVTISVIIMLTVGIAYAVLKWIHYGPNPPSWTDAFLKSTRKEVDHG